MNKEEKIEIVQNVIDLISDENKWTEGRLAKNKYNTPCSIMSPEACKWCVMGALYKYGNNVLLNDEIIDFTYKLTDKSLVSINDSGNRLEVIEILKNYVSSLE